MAEEMQAGITVEWIETDEEPFDPQATTAIFATLEPLEAEQTTFFPPTWNDFYQTYVLPPSVTYTTLPKFESTKRELLINIETTTVNPWEGRLVCIGVLDPNALEPQAINFIQESEQATINVFMAFFEQSPYTTLVAYNVAFDFRYVYAVLQKYRMTSRRWPELGLYDLMQQQKQVKDAFVPGFNKPGTLEQWATYLFGSQPYAPQDAVYKWFKEGNVEEIVNFNTDKLTKAYGLWVLGKVVEGSIPGAEVLSRPSEPGQETPTGTVQGNPNADDEMIPVKCPDCLQDQFMPKTARVINCRICGAPIAHP